MSYILDALKRAESERERGAVPGLHSQSVPLPTPTTGSSVANKRLVICAMVLVLAFLGVLGWRSLVPATQQGSTHRAAAITPTAPPLEVVAPSSVSANPVAAASQVSGVATASVSAPLATSATSAAPAPLNTSAPPAKNNTSDQPSKTDVAVASRTADPRPSNERLPAPAVVTASNVVPIGDMPADVRLTLPKTVISGSAYSSNPAMRMLIINGEVFREGDNPAPDLLLEQIRAKSAVLSFKGQRYSVPY